MRAKHPNQKVYVDDHGTRRFVKNEIVRTLLDAGPFDMNTLARITTFSDEDRAQFAQLIGYSVDGWCELGYVTRPQMAAVDQMKAVEKPND